VQRKPANHRLKASRTAAASAEEELKASRRSESAGWSDRTRRPMQPPRVEIVFVSDVACPWCAIGLASLDQALARLRGEVEAKVRVEPFELNPDMGPDGAEVIPYLARKYGRTPQQVEQGQARIRERGAAVGFSFGNRKHVWNTFDAHRPLHWAGLEGRALELKRALLRAYHGEGRNPGSRDVLVELAGAVGLDAARARSILESSEFTSEVRERERYWLQRGVGGVPLVVVNDSHAIEGAETPEGYERALRRIAQG
jgi:predicted DsbA family dithiol-disulfide isomerase